jgi:HK97 gp10 family phage protein
MKATAQLKGDKEFLQLLKELPSAANEQIVGGAYMRSAKPLVQKEKLLAPEGPTGNLVDSIGAFRTPKRRRTQIGEVTVGPRRGRRYKGNAGHLVEFGTKQRRTRKGANRGKMTKHPFVKPAWEATKNQILDSMTSEMRKSYLRVMKRYASKA